MTVSGSRVGKYVVDGFTAYIDSFSPDENDLIEATRAFHVLRGVMRHTTVQDFSALRVQYQGVQVGLRLTYRMYLARGVGSLPR